MGHNHLSETTGTSPFFANYGYDPRMDFLDEQTLPTDDQEGRSFVVTMTELHAHLRTKMGYVQESSRKMLTEADSQLPPSKWVIRFG